MGTNERVLVIGLDAVEADLLLQPGCAPNLTSLIECGSHRRLRSPSMSTLPGAIWPDIHTGVGPEIHGQYFHPEQIHTGEAWPRVVAQDLLDPERYYWIRAARAGKTIVTFDQIHTAVVPGLAGVQIAEWQLHDFVWGFRTTDQAVMDQLVAAHGSPDSLICDFLHGGTTDGYVSLRRRLHRQIEHKADAAVDLLGRYDWDLAAVTFSQGHCAGHQMWHYHDPESAFHDPDAPDVLKTAVVDTYKDLDTAVGRLVAAAGEDATIVVIASHGMSPSIGGPQLLPEVLRRLGLGETRPPLHRARRLLGAQARRFLRDRVVPRSVTRRLSLADRGLGRPGVKAAGVQNNRVGAIRFNVVGREPSGTVPEEGIDELRETIEEEVMSLRQPRTGELIVTGVTTAADAFGPHHHPDLPDLMVEFRRDLGELDSCVGQRTGLLEIPIRSPIYPRTGDHTDHSLLVVAGHAARALDEIDPSVTFDVAELVLGLLGVDSGVTRDPADRR